MPDLFKTRAQLVIRALQKRLKSGSDGTVEDEDVQHVDSVVDATLRDLAERGVYYVANDEEIDLAAFEWIADCVADNVATDFGGQRNLQAVMFAESRLRIIGATRPSYEVLKTEYF